MQVSVEKTSELSRKMTVTLPEDIIQEKMESRFKSLAREVKIDGFRPGKVPVRVVKKMYSERVRGEITGDLIQTTYFDALKEQDLNPAGHPHIHPSKETTGFEYTAEFEVYPEILLDKIPELEIKKPTATVQQTDVDAMIAKLRDQKKKWQVVERAATKGDQATITFSGVCEGEDFTDGKVVDFEVEIGSKKMIPGFEDELISLEAGAKKTFTITFPEQYSGNNELAGKPAEFEIEVIEVKEAILPEIDTEFIKTYGVEDGTLDSFTADIQSNMERELTQGLKEALKKSVMDALYEKVQVTVPNALIDQEVENIMKPYQDNAKQQNMSLDDMNLPKELFEEQAKRRVALGLILGEVIQKKQIKVNDDKVRSTLEDMAKNYDSPSAVIDWYYSDEKRLNEIKQMVLEQQAIEWIVEQAKVSNESVTFADIMEKQA